MRCLAGRDRRSRGALLGSGGESLVTDGTVIGAAHDESRGEHALEVRGGSGAGKKITLRPRAAHRYELSRHALFLDTFSDDSEVEGIS